ncbi:hypothetical protein BGW37DRAFT_120353 [Umbelopsis sp. PMI_123]|jgi:hypothetical protein|nr:hypothetical protein BGW37DRAFT_120353 [Umbelopsis sp. PMI_123]
MSTSLVAENNNQVQLFGLSQTSPSNLRFGANSTSHINWNRLQNAEYQQQSKQMSVPNTAIPELPKSPAYQLTSNRSSSTQQTLVNALNSSNLKRKHNATPTTDSKENKQKIQAKQQEQPPSSVKPNTTVHSVVTGSQHPFVRYTDAISQRLVLQHPDVVEFWARCPLCHTLICCIDQTSCYRSDAVEKHVEVLHADKVWITSSQGNADYMWGASNPISGGFDQLDMFVDDNKETPPTTARPESKANDEQDPSLKDKDPVERDVLRALALEAKTQFRFTTSHDTQPSHTHKRRRIVVPQCIAGSTAHPRTKCTQTCYLEMIG